MAAPFIALGLKGANKIIDKHFEKLPDKYLYVDTYHPVKAKKKHHPNTHAAANGAAGGLIAGKAADEDLGHSSDDDSQSPNHKSSRHHAHHHHDTSGSSSDRVSTPRTFTKPNSGDPLLDEYEVEEFDDMPEADGYRDVPSNSAGGPISSRYEPEYINPNAYPDIQAPQPQYVSSGPPFTALPYSREPPRIRPQYMPPPPPVGVGEPYFAPPPTEGGRGDRRDRRRHRRRESYDASEGDGYASDYGFSQRSSRPKMVTRRSSSYHGPRRDRNYDADRNYGRSGRSDGGHGRSDLASRSGGSQQLAKREGRGNSGSEHLDRAREKAHRYGLKDEVEGVLTKSKAGLGGAAVGALVGGWAAQKAQVGYAKGNKHSDPNPLLTLLGAAAGGLAVNAAVDKWEDGKKETEQKQVTWDDKYDDNDDRDRRSEGGKSRRSERSQRSRRSRRESRDYGSDGHER